ncbi:MAG: GPR endopeptidase [bacterium]|nr:GPR endopeptidase [bacterium]
MDELRYQNTRRTDLALEERETFEDDDVEIKGVVLEEDYDEDTDIKLTRVIIKDERGAKAMRKPIGTYITIEAPRISGSDEGYHKPVSNLVAAYLEELTNGVEGKHILVAGLGNRNLTADALGPQVIDNLFVTRQLIKEFGDEFAKRNRLEMMSAISPGVMGQTGMESSEILRGIIKETKPDMLVVIDALAARSVSRLNTTIQITDTGISPGAGVGNNRNALNKDSLGIDVIALGVPTVVDAQTIVDDRMENALRKKGFSEEEVYQFLNEMTDRDVENMFVTPKNIDDSIHRISYCISEAINSVFYKEPKFGKA